MKITALRTQFVKVPLNKPITTAIHSIESVACVLLTLETDSDFEGEGYIFTIDATRLRSFESMIQSFTPLVCGQDPHYVSKIWQSVWTEINPSGHKGVTISALSAIDTACWDLIAKSANKPLYHLFGACRDRIKTYASGGLWLSQNVDELQNEAQLFLDQGFKAMKLRIGSANLNTDISRVKAVREVIGDDHELLVDLNQALSPKAAIKLGRALDQFNLGWIEEPVAAYDLKGHAQVTRALSTPIASGETEYTRFGMQTMIEQSSCDILMPDLQRIGGLSEMMRVAALASANNLPISTHIFTEQSLSVAGSAANCISVEHMPWFAPLFNENIELENGEILMPSRPGLGFTFNKEAAKEFAFKPS